MNDTSVYKLTHEGRNIIQELQGGLELLGMLAADQPEIMEVLDQMKRTEGRLRRFVDALPAKEVVSGSR